MDNPIRIKDKVKIYKVHRKTVSSLSCLLMIFMLFSVLVGSGRYGQFIDTVALASASNEEIVQTVQQSDAVFTAAFVGDIMLSRGVEKQANVLGYDALFQCALEHLDECDYVNGNFENPIIDDVKLYSTADKEIHLNANSACIPALINANFTVLSLSNNHATDYGRDGLVNTLNLLNQNGITTVGAGKNIKEAAQYHITDVNGFAVATIAISDIIPSESSATTSLPGILSTNYENYLELVEKAAKEADLVVVNAHWGVEYAKLQTNAQTELGRKLIDAGADVVIGSHPHVTQPVEIYGDGIIFYSLGNFIFDQGWNRTKDSVVVKYTIDENMQGGFEIVPMRIDNGIPRETSNPLFTSRIFRILSRSLNESQYAISDNRLYIPFNLE